MHEVLCCSRAASLTPLLLVSLGASHHRCIAMDAAAQQAKDQAELNELVIWAAARGLLADAEELVARGAELTTKDKHGRCPVHYAAAHGHLGMLQYLSRKGADLEAEDPNARQPLHHAAASGKGLEALRYLIQRSTWLSAADAADDTPLHLAARKGWCDGVKLLLAATAPTELDLANKRGLSALGEAVAGGHVEVAQTLLAAGADPTWRAGGYTLLHVAAGLGQTSTLQLLLDQLGPSNTIIDDSSNEDGATPLHAAAMAGRVAAVQLLLARGANAGIAGCDGTQAWELVPLEAGAAAKQSVKAQKGKQPAPAQQQELQKLREQLKEAARKAGRSEGSRSSKVTSRSEVVAGTAAADGTRTAAAAVQGPVEMYTQLFRELSPPEQNRRVEGFARLTPTELASAIHLSDAAKAAILEVVHAHQLLSVLRAVAALRADEEFQEDAADPTVREALADMGRHGNMDKYAGQRHIVSVATKLKKFHAVMQENGGFKLGLQDVLVPPGTSLSEATAKDAAQLQQLTAAANVACAHAVALISGQRMTEDSSAASRRSVGKAQGVVAKSGSGSEIEATEYELRGDSKRFEGAGTELDRELQQHREAKAVAASSAEASTFQRVRRFLTPSRAELEAMPFGQRMRFEMVNSFIQAVKIMLMLTAFMGVMWCLGLLPSQQEGNLEAHMQQVAQQQQLQHGDVGHEEL